jgi:hypothetical protein
MTTPEMLVLHGDVLHATGATEAAIATWTNAVAAARRLEARAPELRALTRLVGAVDDADRASLVEELRGVHASFTEGFETADLREAAEVLAAH